MLGVWGAAPRLHHEATPDLHPEPDPRRAWMLPPWWLCQALWGEPQPPQGFASHSWSLAGQSSSPPRGTDGFIRLIP